MHNAHIKKQIRQGLVRDSSLLSGKDSFGREELRQAILQVFRDMNEREHLYVGGHEREKIIEELLDELVGFGPIEALIKDPTVTEIMINGPQRVYVERVGKKELSTVTFEDEEQLMYLVYRFLAPTRRRVDEMYPYTEISLPDGSRVNIIIKPLALNGPIVTIRKFLKELKTIDDLIAHDTLDKRMADFLVAAIRAKVNIVFAGATGTGKTTTLNVLSSYIANDERIVTIEDTAELRLSQDHVVRLEGRPANIEGKGAVSIRDLFRNCLRMRPDRIILGEIRGDESLDMLQAICSGHKGALSVLHASSPQDVIYRIETMILTSGVPISVEAIQRQIAAAVELIVLQEQLVDGSRKITHITQVNGLGKDKQVVLEDLFVFEFEALDPQGKAQGKWRACGITPCFYEKLKKTGIDLSKSVFDDTQAS